MMRGTVPLLLASSLHAAVIGTAVHWHAAGANHSPEHGSTTLIAAGSPTSVMLVSASRSQAQAPQAQRRQAAPVAAMPSPEATPTPWESPIEPSVEVSADTAPDTSTEEVGEAAGTASFTVVQEVYLPRNELSLPPRPLSLIDIGFPPHEAVQERLEATLAVYIDELGQVRKVEAVRGELPPALLESARNAFLGAQFKAGEQQGRAVKSFIHVAVVFEETPVQNVAASRALPMN